MFYARHIIAAMTSVILLGYSTIPAAAHPSEEFAARETPVDWDQRENLLMGLDNGTLVFPDPVPSAELSETERYMLFGCDCGGPNATIAESTAFLPWYIYIYRIVKNYEHFTGEVPAVITPEVVAQSMNKSLQELDPVYLEFAKSPITGEYPTLNSENFSPGNLYIRLITTPERIYLASHLEKYQEEWIYHRSYDDEIQAYRQIKYLSPIFYVRSYGDSGILYGEILYSKAFEDSL